MSNSSSEKSEKSFDEDKDKIKSEIGKNEKDKEKLIDPLSLLTSDLLKEINGVETQYIEEKKNNTNENETQKDSDENEENYEVTDPSQINKDSVNEFSNFKMFKKEEKEKYEESKKLDKRRKRQQSSISFNNTNLHLNINYNDKPIFSNDQRMVYNNFIQNQNRNIYNMQMNNFTNKMNFFNNSFTMNGKSGWICTNCKNFNYESKYLIILLYIFFEFII